MRMEAGQVQNVAIHAHAYAIAHPLVADPRTLRRPTPLYMVGYVRLQRQPKETIRQVASTPLFPQQRHDAVPRASSSLKIYGLENSDPESI
jgi:hypothetical protein